MKASYNTDKFKSGLVEAYEPIFDKLICNGANVLEIGIHKGGSLEWMGDYLVNAKITGIDIVLPDVNYEKDITQVICNQNDTEGLIKVGDKYGKFDLIIDDGLHSYRETRNSFYSLIPFLKNGGVYVIEDWAACYRENEPLYRDMDKLVFEILHDKRIHRFCKSSIIDAGSYSLAVFTKANLLV